MGVSSHHPHVTSSEDWSSLTAHITAKSHRLEKTTQEILNKELDGVLGRVRLFNCLLCSSA